MPVKWKSSKYPGVRFYEHETRKHGVKWDRYYAIRYQIKGKRREEGLGWASDGWNESKAALKLAELKEAAKTGKGPARLAEARELADKERQARLERAKARERDGLTFGAFWDATYFPQCQADKKPETVRREASLYKQWLGPALRKKPLREIAPTDLERIKQKMAKAGLAPRTIEYALAVARQVFNKAKAAGRYSGDSPTSLVRKPRHDNRRTRFLSPEEARNLLDALQVRSPLVHDLALLSLQCGLRFGEATGLTWGCVDFELGQLQIKDGKGGKSRVAYLTDIAKAMLIQREPGGYDDFVFEARGGGPIKQISAVFWRVVKDMGLNNGVTDPRDKVVFHTLRHTFASWLVMAGTPLYTVGKLLGHSTSSMTERYSHLAPDHMREAVRALEEYCAKANSESARQGEIQNG